MTEQITNFIIALLISMALFYAYHSCFYTYSVSYNFGKRIGWNRVPVWKHLIIKVLRILKAKEDTIYKIIKF